MCSLFSIYFIQGKPDEEQLTELKQELDIDFHRIPVSELCQRLGTNLETGLTGAQVPSHYMLAAENIQIHTDLL